jgi:hypothetical protein
VANAPAWLYPSRPVDRSLRARVQRFVAARARRLRAAVPPVLTIAREVSRVTGKSTIGVLADFRSAWREHGISPSRYASFMIWDVPRAARGGFIGSVELDPFHSATTNDRDHAVLFDKAAFGEHARRHGLPCVPTLAVVNRREGADAGAVLRVDDPSRLPGVLERLTEQGAVFLKPAVGKQGIGAFSVASGGRARDGDGSEVSLADLVESVFAYRHPAGAFGYVVQPFLVSHPAMISLTGSPGLTTLRVITAVVGGEALVLRAFLKLTAPGRMTNNFQGGSSGTLLTNVDIESGRLGDLVGILRPENRFVVERTATHPVTKRRIAGEELPEWKEAFEISRRGALIHPRTASLGWDISLTPEGWTILEANTSWGPGGPQAASRVGLRPELAKLFPEHFP